MQPPSLGKRILLEIWDIIKFLVPIVIVVFFIRTYIAQPFIVDGESMAPNFHTGHYLIIDELSYRFMEPKTGDVIVLRYPVDPKRFFLKRIIGVPGDTVSIKDGKVFITNAAYPKGFQLIEPYHVQKTYPAGQYSNVTLKADEYFVMGDNRSGSSDSRTWGIVPKEDIVGHALFRLFPIRLATLTPGSVDDFK